MSEHYNICVINYGILQMNSDTVQLSDRRLAPVVGWLKVEADTMIFSQSRRKTGLK